MKYFRHFIFFAIAWVINRLVWNGDHPVAQVIWLCVVGGWILLYVVLFIRRKYPQQ